MKISSVRQKNIPAILADERRIMNKAVGRSRPAKEKCPKYMQQVSLSLWKKKNH